MADQFDPFHGDGGAGVFFENPPFGPRKKENNSSYLSSSHENTKIVIIQYHILRYTV